MSNLTVTGNSMLIGGRKAKLICFSWEPTAVYYQDYANLWHKSTDGLRWTFTTDPRQPILSTAAIHGAGWVRVNAIVVLHAHGDPFSAEFTTAFGSR